MRQNFRVTERDGNLNSESNLILIQTVKSEPPNDGFLAKALNRCFSFSGVLLKFWKLVLCPALKSLSIRLFFGELGSSRFWSNLFLVPQRTTFSSIKLNLIWDIVQEVTMNYFKKVERNKKPSEQDSLANRPVECSQLSNVSHSNESYYSC